MLVSAQAVDAAAIVLSIKMPGELTILSQKVAPLEGVRLWLASWSKREIPHAIRDF